MRRPGAARATVAAATGDDETATGAWIAAGVGTSLTYCPRCSESVPLGTHQGARICGKCQWDERTDPLTQEDTTRARIDVDLTTGAGGRTLTYRRLPDTEQLPNPGDVLVLDATPRKNVYAAAFGVPVEHVHVEKADAYTLPNAHVTQFTNGTYHRSTLTPTRWRRCRSRRCSSVSRGLVGDPAMEPVFTRGNEALPCHAR